MIGLHDLWGSHIVTAIGMSRYRQGPREGKRVWERLSIRYTVPLFFLFLLTVVGMLQLVVTKNAPHLQCGTPWGVYNFMIGHGFFHVSVVERPGVPLHAFNDWDYWFVNCSSIPEKNEVLKSMVEEINQISFPRKVKTHRYYVEYECRYVHAMIFLGILAAISGIVCYFRIKQCAHRTSGR